MAESAEETVLSQTFLADSDVTFDNICQPCNGDGKHIEAVGFCEDCSEFLCVECYSYHLKPPLTRHHKLLNIEEAKKFSSTTGYLDICTEKCSRHGEEVIQYFCLDHDCLGCGVCITLDHRNCKGVQDIPTTAEDIGNGEEFSTLIKQLDMIMLQTDVLVHTSRDNKLKSQSYFEKALHEVQQVRKDTNEALDKLEKDIKTEAENMKMQDMQKMDENIKSCNTLQNLTKKVFSKLKGLKQNGQNCNLFVAMKTGKRELKSLVQLLEDISNCNSVSNYQFQPSEQLENFLRHSGSSGGLCRRDGIKTKATKVKEICVCINNESQACDIRGLAKITSGRLAIADKESKKVKLIDTKQSRVIAEYKLTSSPGGITATEETGEIAVTHTDDQEIVLLRVKGDRLYEHKKIKTTGACFGMACIKDKFVVSLQDPERIEIIDTKGNVLHSIEKDENGEQLFSNVWSLTVDQDTGTIYVPDSTKHTVTRLSLSGHVIGTYTDTDLTYARWVTIDTTGAVYVCNGDKNIHQITSDCRKIGIFLTRKEGLDKPISMCYDGNTDCLYVGQMNKNILVYQLC